MATSFDGKLAGSVEKYDMGHSGVERIRGDALGGTSHDAQDMYRMGKKQELRVSSRTFRERNFN
jgi:choline transport protein